MSEIAKLAGLPYLPCTICDTCGRIQDDEIGWALLKPTAAFWPVSTSNHCPTCISNNKIMSQFHETYGPNYELRGMSEADKREMINIRRR